MKSKLLAFCLEASCAMGLLVVAWGVLRVASPNDARGDDVTATDESQSTVVELTLPDVFVGQPCGLTVPLKNCGAADLHLRQVNTGCTCTQADVKPQILRSQKTALLELKFSGAEKAGARRQHVTLAFSSDSAPDLRLNVFASGTVLD